MSVVALVLAAGRGVRLGRDTPKALVCVAGRSLWHWSAETLGRSRAVHAVLPVLHADGLATCEALRARWKGPARLLEPALGGETRQDSVCAGLQAAIGRIPDAEWVLVHDAARCLVEEGDAEAVLDAARETGAAIPVIPVADTVKRVDGARVLGTPERDTLALAQTPQAFRPELLQRALDAARRDGFAGTDCASLVERLGVEVRTSPGRVENLKVTRPQDLALVEARLRGAA